MQYHHPFFIRSSTFITALVHCRFHPQFSRVINLSQKGPKFKMYKFNVIILIISCLIRDLSNL